MIGENIYMSKKSITNKRCLRFLQNSSSNTIKTYIQSIRKYEHFHKCSIEELINEALDEQSERVPEHMLKVIDRIEEFQNHLVSQNLVHGTIQLHMTHIKTIYHKNRIHLPYLEPLNEKATRRREYIEFKDILKKEEIKKALPYLRPPYRARAITIAQAGLSNEECEHLTTRAFIDETHKYHQCDDDIEALEWLADENHPIIWVTKVIRIKTKKPYYALIGPEAVNTIASAKLYERTLPSHNGSIPSKLLNGNKCAFGNSLRNINQKLGFGMVAEESKLRSHMLRKFNATYIRGGALTYEEQSLISNSQIDEMQGRGKTAVQDTYIKTNPLQQKLIYAKVLNNVSLYHKYDYHLTDDDVVLTVHNDESENIRLKKEVEDLTQKLSQRKTASEKVNALRNELGDETFNEMIAELLSGN